MATCTSEATAFLDIGLFAVNIHSASHHVAQLKYLTCDFLGADLLIGKHLHGLLLFLSHVAPVGLRWFLSYSVTLLIIQQLGRAHFCIERIFTLIDQILSLMASKQALRLLLRFSLADISLSTLTETVAISGEPITHLRASLPTSWLRSTSMQLNHTSIHGIYVARDLCELVPKFIRLYLEAHRIRPGYGDSCLKMSALVNISHHFPWFEEVIGPLKFRLSHIGRWLRNGRSHVVYGADLAERAFRVIVCLGSWDGKLACLDVLLNVSLEILFVLALTSDDLIFGEECLSLVF